jgi:RNA polymerase sigma factor (sigma-70 family)
MNVQKVTPITERQGDEHLPTLDAASTDERLLVAEAKSGRSSAFGELYERHRLKVCRTAFRILRNQEDAEDAAQRAFQRAFTNLGRFREDSTFSTWVTRIAINEALMLLRQRRANVPLLDGNRDGDDAHYVVDPADKAPTPEQAFAETERRAAVVQAISHLRERLRAVVLLRELQELTSAETARRLGLTVSAVKARTFHARRRMRRHLERRYRGAFASL